MNYFWIDLIFVLVFLYMAFHAFDYFNFFELFWIILRLMVGNLICITLPIAFTFNYFCFNSIFLLPLIISIPFIVFFPLFSLRCTYVTVESSSVSEGIFLRPCRDCIERIIWDPLLDIKDFSFIYQDRYYVLHYCTNMNNHVSDW